MNAQRPISSQGSGRGGGHAAAGRVLCVLGPTNTGKTHLAVERLLGHQSGIIGLPLRLLAREIYDRAVALKGPARVALVTGEEKIIPPRAQWFVCTVEAMPLERDYDFLCIDEIQLCGDADRGHIFTERLLHARGRQETMFLGADTVRALIRRLVPQAEFIARPRLSALEYAGPKKLSRLPPRSAVVAFSAADVYAIAELLRRQRGGAAVVLGALSPRARNAQVAMFQNREVEVMVATDAIGMGLNLDIEHMAFAETSKFDGVTIRPLTPAELGQIAGRAGRHLRNGTFGTTNNPYGGDNPALDPDVIEKIENHRFDPITQARWRNAALDFRSPQALLRSLEAPPPRDGLVRAREADDILALKALLQDAEVTRRSQGRDRVGLLWQVCEIPDFRKSLHDGHIRLLSQIYRHLCDRDGRLPTDWVAGQLTRIDRTDGDIDTLSNRLAHIRTWTYVAHRGSPGGSPNGAPNGALNGTLGRPPSAGKAAGWLDDAALWQEKTRAIEDRLSDALHERLTQRFVDRRAAVLTRHLRDFKTLDIRIAEDDALMVEGESIGRIVGLRFAPDGHETGEEQRALSAAAHRALGPALEARARDILGLGDERFGLSPEGAIILKDDPIHAHGAPLAKLAKGAMPLEPRLLLLADEALPAEHRRAVEDRLQRWLDAHLRQHLGDLYRLRDADLKGAARGLAFQLATDFGAVLREDVNDLLRAMDQNARHPLRRLGVTFGEMHIFLPKLLKPKPTQLKTLLFSINNERTPLAPPPPGLTSFDILEPRPERWWLAAGYLKVENRVYRLDIVQRIAEGARKAEHEAKHPPAIFAIASVEPVKPVEIPAEAEIQAETTGIETTGIEAAGIEAAGIEAVAIDDVEAPAEVALETLAAEPGAESAPEPASETAPETAPEAAPEAAPETADETAGEPAAESKPAAKPARRKPRPDGSFPPAVEWMNLAGCGTEQLRLLLIKLGYRPVQRSLDEGEPAIEMFLRSGKAIQAKRQREQEKRQREAAIIKDSPFAALAKLKQR